MNPKPLVSLNHLTVPVVRIVLLHVDGVLCWMSGALPYGRHKRARDRSPHDGPPASPRALATDASLPSPGTTERACSQFGRPQERSELVHAHSRVCRLT